MNLATIAAISSAVPYRGRAIALAPPSLKPEIVEIGQLPLYNQDFDDGGNPPPTWTAFRQQVKPYDAVPFVTPEYNRSVQLRSRTRST